MLGYYAHGSQPQGYFGPDLLQDVLILEATAPSLSLSGSTAVLEEKTVLRMAANAPSFALNGTTGQLETKARIELEATAPNLALAGSAAQLETISGIQVDSISAGPYEAGDTVTINHSNANATGKTLSIPAGAITLDTQDANSSTFTVPDVQSFGDLSTRYNQSITFTLVDGSKSDTFSLQISPTTGHDFDTIAAVTGIYADDTGVAVNDEAIGQAISGTFEVVDLANGALSSESGGTYRYNVYDISGGVWLGSADETVQGASLILEASAPNLSLAGSTAQIETTSTLTLNSTAPNLSLIGSTAQIVESGLLTLEAAAPSLSLSGSAATLQASGILELQATAPNLSLSGSTASLETGSTNLLRATPMQVNVRRYATDRVKKFDVYMSNTRDLDFNFTRPLTDTNSVIDSVKFGIEEGSTITLGTSSVSNPIAQTEFTSSATAGESLVYCRATFDTGVVITGYAIINVIDPSL